MGSVAATESSSDLSTSSSADAREWAKASGTRPRVELESLIEDEREEITSVEPWRKRASALPPKG